ncbi:unnamed protein product [Linum trigynum]|uniref:Uncharacterized protein n=1 Tax=Linum trigynum TaxID=586398 RepID=A0AAV2ER71_9ROSI
MAASSASCCLNRLSPPPATSTLPSSFPAIQLPWFNGEKLRSHCVVGMACMVIGLETAGSDWTAGAMMSSSGAADAGDLLEKVTAGGNEKLTRGPRWSDKRMCPSWQHNSLETIVPENLPRPSASRRSESVELTGGGSARDSPAAGDGGFVKREGRLGSCFSI